MLELIEKVQGEGAEDDTVTLSYELRQKSRQRIRLDSGDDAAIMLPPATWLDDGDRLRSANGTTVRIIAAIEAVTTARTEDPLHLARACYHLGNRHVPVQVGAGWVRYQPDHVLDDMVRSLGLEMSRESVPFEPERGAYHGTARHSHHDPADASPHGHHP